LHVVLCLTPYERSSLAVQFLATASDMPLFLCFKWVVLPYLSLPTTPNVGEQVLKKLHQNMVIQGTNNFF